MSKTVFKPMPEPFHCTGFKGEYKRPEGFVPAPVTPLDFIGLKGCFTIAASCPVEEWAAEVPIGNFADTVRAYARSLNCDDVSLPGDQEAAGESIWLDERRDRSATECLTSSK